MSAMWQLSKDILHSVYSEWLGWKDLSKLDIACVEKIDGKEWLSSLTDLRKGRAVDGRISDEKKRKFYVWLGRRMVFFMEGFPLRLIFLQDLVEELESYCPVLQSLSIEISSSYNLSSDCLLESNLSVFLGHCHNLRKVHSDTIPKVHSESIFRVLEEVLRENSIVEFCLTASCHSHAIERFLAKHATSLTHFYLYWSDEMAESIASTLLKNQIHLRELRVVQNKDISSQIIASFMTYPASAGNLLKILEIWSVDGTSSLNGDDVLVSVATSCPKLIRLRISNSCSEEKLRLLYELCRHLQHASIEGTICIDEAKSFVSVEVKDSIEDWVPCLSYALRRRQFKQVTLRLSSEVNYHPVGNLKAMLEPYQIGVVTSASEASSIAILQDLPHLDNLHIKIDRRYTDATLTAITEHAKSLTKMDVLVDNSNLDNFYYTDKLSSKIIEACQMLKMLWGYGCGLESLLAVSRNASLTGIFLSIHEEVSAERLDTIMAQDKVKWSSNLEMGDVISFRNRLHLKFSKKYHNWTKDEIN